jgi:hypothetical protein
MRGRSLILLLALNGCGPPREARVPADPPQAYLDSLPTVSAPPSPYRDSERTKWFRVGYREGWQRMTSSELEPKPWYPFHVTCSTNRGFYEAQVKGFEAGVDACIQHFVEGVKTAVALQRQSKREPNGPANRSQPVRPETNRTSGAAGSGR